MLCKTDSYAVSVEFVECRDGSRVEWLIGDDYGKIAAEMLVDDTLDDLHDDWHLTHGSKVRWVRSIAGFKGQLDDGVFPLTRNVGSGDAGIDDMQNDVTNSWESGFDHTDIHFVGTTRS